jgi:dinuclear metal center YbgI/SA1388 family protein
MITIRDITRYLDSVAPPALQESYDNAGLLVGNDSLPVSRVLITLDCTEEVVDEAIKTGCNLIVAHHPIVFKGLKRLTGKNYIERTVIKAIKNDIAIYASHTNLDNIKGGVNYKIGRKLGLKDIKILDRKKGILRKLTVFVPKENTDELLEALHAAGAGNIGNYTHCSFRVSGTGTFKPTDKADPHIGKQGRMEHVNEEQIEVVLPMYNEQAVLKAMFEVHPYEEVAYFLHTLENEYQETGSGAIGELPEAMHPAEFLRHLKTCMQLNTVRYTAMGNKKIQKVALCGGSGSFLLQQAIRSGADAFVTADFKYHEFFDAEGRILIADIGHYESEIFTKELFYDLLSEKFPNIALDLSLTVTNPISYI